MLAAAVFLVLKDGVELALGAEDDFVVAHQLEFRSLCSGAASLGKLSHGPPP